MRGHPCNIGWPKAYAHWKMQTPLSSRTNGQIVNNDLLHFRSSFENDTLFSRLDTFKLYCLQGDESYVWKGTLIDLKIISVNVRSTTDLPQRNEAEVRDWSFCFLLFCFPSSIRLKHWAATATAASMTYKLALAGQMASSSNIWQNMARI